jgi:hypothetical protein
MTLISQIAQYTRADGIRLVLLAVGLAGVTLAAPTLHRGTSGLVFIAIFFLVGIGAFRGARLAERVDERVGLAIILAGAAAMRVAILFFEPYLSSDIFRYIWDGRVQAAGINPYRYIPHAPELTALRDTAIWPSINRPDYAVTIYPPAAQMIFLAITRVGESVTVMRLGLLAFEAVSIWAIVALLRRQGMPATRVAAYAWHPLPVWEIAGNGHVDAAMIALVLVGLMLFLGGRTLLAGLAITVGALIKPIALLALSVLWRPWNWRLVLVFVFTVILFYLPYFSVGPGVIGSLPLYLEEEGLVSGRSFKPLWLLEQATGPLRYGSPIYLLFSSTVIVSLALAAGFRTDRSEAASLRWLRWLLVAYLTLISPNYPWYFLVLVPFLALSPSAATWALTLGGALFYDVVPNDRLLPSYEARITLFTLVALAAIAHDLWRERSSSLANSVVRS